MTIQAHADDNNADYTCEARQPALIAPKRASITLDVQYPIVSYSLYPSNIKRETVRMGQGVKLVCVTGGGNPLAHIVWYKNDVEIDSSFMASGRESRNTFSFHAQDSDNNARFRCELSNQLSTAPLKAEIILTVHTSRPDQRCTSSMCRMQGCADRDQTVIAITIAISNNSQ